jgi:hypothetical protein
MLSLNLPQILVYPNLTAGAAGAQKQGPLCPKGGLKSGGTMPKSHPGRNAAEARNRRFRQVFALMPVRCATFANPQKWL